MLLPGVNLKTFSGTLNAELLDMVCLCFHKSLFGKINVLFKLTKLEGKVDLVYYAGTQLG